MTIYEVRGSHSPLSEVLGLCKVYQIPTVEKAKGFCSLTQGAGSACSGTLLTNCWVLTAAHCTKGIAAANIKVSLGCSKVDPLTCVYKSQSVSRNIPDARFNGSDA